MWFLYLLRCNNGAYYTGITKDIHNRIERHNAGKGAKFTRSHRPVELVYYEQYHTESEARKREREVKGWKRKKKETLIRGLPSSALEAHLL
jgi:putative endonuclease